MDASGGDAERVPGPVTGPAKREVARSRRQRRGKPHYLKRSVWDSPPLVAEEARAITVRMYFRDELVLMLERAGFRDVEVRGGFDERAPTPEDDTLVYVATS